MGIPASHWDDFVFVFSSNVVNGQMVTVQWDSDLYEPVSNNAVIVGMDILAEGGLMVDLNVQMLGPYREGGTWTKKRVWRTVYVPPMIENEFTPCLVWEELVHK